MARKEAMEKFYADDDKEDFDNFSKVIWIKKFWIIDFIKFVKN